jgi:hypothetical protein
MRVLIATVGLILVLFWTDIAASQASSAPSKTNPSPHPTQQTAKPAKKQLSPKQQLWCPVLDTALVEARALEAPMRAFLLEATAAGLKNCAPGQARSALIEAFHATLSMPERQEDVDQEAQPADDSSRALFLRYQTKTDLQESILRDLLSVDEVKGESLLAQTEPDPANAILEELISRAVTGKKLERALQLLNRVPSGDGFPYHSATQLMLELPTEREADKQEIFLRAMASDRESPSFRLGSEDFCQMIVRFHEHLAPGLVLQGIHQALDHARDMNSQVAINSKSGDLHFNNVYEYRLFELLPILRPLDPADADKLLNDSQTARDLLRQFPNGLQSIDPAIRDTPRKDNEPPAISGGDVGSQLGSVLERKEISKAYQSRVDEIGHVADDNPAQAIPAAAALPDAADRLAPRAQALLAIARAAVTKHPTLAKQALEEMAESLKKTDPSSQKSYWDQSSLWVQAIDIASMMRDLDLAGKLLKLGLQQAEQLRTKDLDPDDPNQALEAWWPSSAAAARLVAASALSPRSALELAQQIDSPAVRALCEVKLANKGLGARGVPVEIVVNKKSTNWEQYSDGND